MSDSEFSLEDVARYWDDNAAAWAREVRQGHDLAREFLNNPAFLALIGDLRGRQVLDAGGGDGYNTRILARAGAHMTGVDLSARMIGLAQEEERRAPLGIRYARASYTDLAGFAGASFASVSRTRRPRRPSSSCPASTARSPNTSTRSPGRDSC